MGERRSEQREEHSSRRGNFLNLEISAMEESPSPTRQVLAGGNPFVPARGDRNSAGSSARNYPLIRDVSASELRAGIPRSFLPVPDRGDRNSSGSSAIGYGRARNYPASIASTLETRGGNSVSLPPAATTLQSEIGNIVSGSGVNCIFAEFRRGENILNSLLSRYNTPFLILSATGPIATFTLQQPNSTTTITYEGNYWLLSLGWTGNHFTASISNNEHRVIGGELQGQLVAAGQVLLTVMTI